MEWKMIRRERLIMNLGQIEGLEINPRRIDWENVRKLEKSLEECPELLECRGLIVYPWQDLFVVLCGNSRLQASASIPELPCIVIDKDTSIEKMREYIIKDNLNFGKWNPEALSRDFDKEDMDLANISFENKIEKIKKEKTELHTRELAIKLAPNEFEFVNKKLLDIGGGYNRSRIA